MQENNEIRGENAVQFDSFRVLAEILRFKYLIIIFTLLVTAAMGVYIFTQPNWYASTTNLIPPKSSGSAFEGMMGNLSSTLRNFGLSKIGPKTDGSYSMSILLDNRTVKDSIIRKYQLRKLYDMPKAKDDEVRLAFQENLNVTTELDGNYTVTVLDTDPIRAAAMATDFVEISNGLAKEVFQTESKLNRAYLESRIQSTDSVLSATSRLLEVFSKKYQVFMPETQAKSISQALIDIKSDIIKQEINLQLLTNRYGATDPMTSMQKQVLEQMKEKLSDAETKPGFGGNFAVNDAAEVGIQFMRLYAELETFTKVKAFLLPMLEEQRINENRDTRSFIVLDKASVPDKKFKPKRSLYLLGAFFGAIVLSIVVVLLIAGAQDFKKRYILNVQKIKNEKAR